MAASRAAAMMRVSDDLCAAAKDGDLERVATLLKKGARWKHTNKDGTTAMHLAAGFGHEPVVKELLARGAKPYRKDKSGWTALHSAAAGGHHSVVQTLLAHGADVHCQTKHGSTPLHLAARYGPAATVEALVAHGADIHCRKDNGKTALHLVAFNEHDGVVQALLARGADVHCRDEESWTPLHCAARNGTAAMVEALLARGADAHLKMKSGWTPLHYAARYGTATMVAALVAHRVDIHCRKDDGMTALHLAAFNEHEGVAKALMALVADIHCVDNDGDTPFHKAARRNKLSVAQELWRAGADPLRKNNKGETPLSLLPEHSPLREQMCHPITELQKLWLGAKAAAITHPQLLAALKADHITSFSDFVLAHHLLLVAVRQRVLTRSQIATFGGSRDYLLENVYLPVTKFSLSNEHKFWLSGLLSYAERQRFIRDGNAVLVKIVADLRSEIRHVALEMQSALVAVAREINILHRRVSSLEQWADEAANNFEHLCEGQQQVLSDMKNMAASLQELHGLLQKQQRNRTVAGVLAFCLAMIPVVGGALAGASFAAAEVAFGINVEMFSSGASSAVAELMAVDISHFKTVSFLMSDQCVSKLEPVARKRVEAVVEQTDFKTLPNLQERLTVVVEELKDSDHSQEPEEDEMEAELRQRFNVLASRSRSGKEVATAQDAIPELQHILQTHLNQADTGVSVDVVDVEDVAMENMNESGLMDVDAFFKSFHELQEKYPSRKRQREPPELRQRFRNASGTKNVLHIKLAKRLLHVLFDSSRGEQGSSPSHSSLSFTRTKVEWNESEVESLLTGHGRESNVIDEEGFVNVGMKVLFG